MLSVAALVCSVSTSMAACLSEKGYDYTGNDLPLAPVRTGVKVRILCTMISLIRYAFCLATRALKTAVHCATPTRGANSGPMALATRNLAG